MSIGDDLSRKLAASERPPEIEYEIRYLQRDPPGSAFAYDLLYLDREVRRTAREERDDLPREPIERRRRRRPLPIAEGLIVRESHHSDFSFFLDVPPALYDLILSDPVEFFVRVSELSLIGNEIRKLVLRRRQAGTDSPSAEEDTIQERGDAGIQSEDEGKTGGTYVRIQRMKFTDGTVYEIEERIER